MKGRSLERWTTAETIENRLQETGSMSRNIGIVGGAALWLLAL